MPRVLEGSQGGGRFIMGEVPIYADVVVQNRQLRSGKEPTLGTVLRSGPRGVRFLVSEVPRYRIDNSQVARCRAKWEQLESFQGLLPQSQGQNLAVTFLYVPCSYLTEIVYKVVL